MFESSNFNYGLFFAIITLGLILIIDEFAHLQFGWINGFIIFFMGLASIQLILAWYKENV